MTCAYSACFVGLWGISILAVPVCVVVFIIGGLSPDPVISVTTNVLAALLVFFALYTRLWPGVKH